MYLPLELIACATPPPFWTPRFDTLVRSFTTDFMDPAELKAKGNALFKAKDYQGSIGVYTEAIAATEAPDAKGVLHSNRSTCAWC